MKINFFRSSSYTCWDFCPHKYYIIYVLGHLEPSNKKAELGTIFHKVMQILANANIATKNNCSIVQDDEIGCVDFGSKYFLDSDAILYKLCRLCFDYYSKKSAHVFTEDDHDTILQWVIKTSNSLFDPRKLNIVQAEQKFDFEIKKEWARLEDGNYLRLKGTIDLLLQPTIGTTEILDWKTGRRFCWNSGTEKDFNKLRKDPQLLIYYYAGRYLYPTTQQIMITINFINDGGAFTLPMIHEDLDNTENILRERFELIKTVQIPQKNITWKCKKLCHFGKTMINDGSCTICEFLHHKLVTLGLNEVERLYTKQGHVMGYYTEPGI